MLTTCLVKLFIFAQENIFTKNVNKLLALKLFQLLIGYFLFLVYLQQLKVDNPKIPNFVKGALTWGMLSLSSI